MSKEEFFQQIAPDIKELAAGCMTMDEQLYEKFKHEVIEECDPRARGFLSAVLSVIDKTRRR